MLSSKQIRSAFIKFFEELGHENVPSSPVVPMDDPTLLFANAGMNQFKDIFLNIGTRPYNRAANTQKCIRVSGKHNDLEEVGVDTYHHTFFEMLGNWSFGDYFKAEAIEWAWRFLTDHLGLPKDRLYATVFAGNNDIGLEADTEAEELWKKVTDIDPSHIMRFGMKDNFWQMADTGPCGPCSEIHIDLTADKSGGKLVNASDPRVIEIWNLVFIQFDLDREAKLTALPAKHIDTGMGLERLSAVVKHLGELKNGKLRAFSNYGSDLFVPIIRKIEEITGCEYGKNDRNLPDRYDNDDCENTVDAACRVISDHLRTLVFAITDGASPSNEGRGYVLRRILRRASRYGRKLNMHQPFIYKLVPTVIDIMGDTFVELKEKSGMVTDIIKAEEESFGRTLDRGLDIFERVAGKIADADKKIFPGSEAFKLYDTFGFPFDLTQLLAREKGLAVDLEEFEKLMDKQRQRARAAEKQTSVSSVLKEELELPDTDDSLKYDKAMECEGRVLGWIAEGKWINTGELNSGSEAYLVTNQTCFYAESGGQIGDRGKIKSDRMEFVVSDTQKINGKTTIHRGKLLNGKIQIGEQVKMLVDKQRRRDTMNNHTVTHLLQWALRNVLGEHIKQAGSYVCDEYLRFDFTNNKAMKTDEIERTEQLVIEKIDSRQPVVITEMPIAEALDMGVTALFGEKYGELVRVVAIGAETKDKLTEAFSKELCGGTHIENTSSIMDFKIIREESLQTGVRRITAMTGRKLRDLMHQRYATVTEMSHILKTSPEELSTRIDGLIKENRKLKKQIEQGPSTDLSAESEKLLKKIVKIGNAEIIVSEFPSVSSEKLRAQIDWLRQKTSGLVAVLGTRDESKVQLIAAIDKDLIKKGLSAGKIIKQIAKVVGGGGGGRDDMAQAGGKDPGKLPEALEQANKIIRNIMEEQQ